MIKVNLIPKEERKKARVKKVGLPKISIKGWDVYISLALIVISVFLILFLNFNYVRKIKKIKSDIVSAKEELKRLEPEVALVRSIEQKQQELNVLIDIVKSLNSNRALMVHILDELNKHIPDYMWLTEMNVSSGKIVMNGITFSNLLVTQFMQNLENSDYISNVSLFETKGIQIEEHNLMQFSITGNVHPAGGG